VVEPIFPAPQRPDDRRPVLGHAMVAVAAALFAFNGTVSKVILGSGLSSERVSQIRSTGALVGLLAGLAVLRPAALRVRPRELPFLAVFGVCGLAFVQWFYFVAIHRLAIGVALLIQYVAPLLVALWARFAYHEHVRRRIWLALALALAGLTLIVEIWHGTSLDGLGLAASVAAALTYALYVLLAERGVTRRDPISLSAYGFLFASLWWAVVQPWWSFPAGRVAAVVPLQGHLSHWHLPVWALSLWMVVLGTIVPFALVVSALRHISATRAGIVAMLEPVVAIVVAWVWLGESLQATQLAGGAVVLTGIVLAQTAR
jgi:drug/metabolite transporter (DMT)-like permease